MKLSRKTMYAAALPLTIGGLLATTAATQASAAVHPPARHVATGRMELANPLQYEQFQALQGFGRNHGQVEYTNWAAQAAQFGETGSGVYAPEAAPIALTFHLGGDYAHTLNGAGLKLVALSNDQLRFTGTGSYNADPAGYPWKIAGLVRGDHFNAVIVYGGTGNPGYKLVMTGTIAADGSVAGTAKGLQAGQPDQALTFSMPAGAFPAVLHYTARIQADQIRGHDATFQFTIPGKVPGLKGTQVVVKVHDGGWGARHDTYREGAPAPLVQYKIIGGPGVTVR
jgi:hypothetical protein